MKLSIEKLTYSYRSTIPVLQNIKLEALPGEITILVGPNASGKTTLLKCIAQRLKPKGKICLGDHRIDQYNREKTSKIISYLPQENASKAQVTVFEAVLLGRLHTLSLRVGKKDLALTEKALADAGILNLADRTLGELSGGQQQMVSIAQTLVRKSKILLLDEPTNNLDLKHQLEILDLIRSITIKRKMITIIVLHDLALSAKYGNKLAVLLNGKIYASGYPQDILTQSMIKNVYDVNARVCTANGITQITPVSTTKS